jgi:hypothetical protein
LRQKSKNPASTPDMPVITGRKGLSYDVGTVEDEGRRNRILANRASAKSSRQRRLEEARARNETLARLEDENNSLREANAALERRITDTHAAILRLTSLPAPVVMSCASEFSLHPTTVPRTGNSLFSWEQEAPRMPPNHALNGTCHRPLPRYPHMDEK